MLGRSQFFGVFKQSSSVFLKESVGGNSRLSVLDERVVDLLKEILRGIMFPVPFL